MGLAHSFKGTYQGRTSVGLRDVTVHLALAESEFVLSIHCRAPYEIESDCTLRGSFVTRDDGITLQSREYSGYVYETVKRESSGPSSEKLDARAAGPESDRAAALEIGIDECPFPLLLARSDEDSGYFTEPFYQENERRRAEWEARERKRDAAAAFATVIGQAAQAFKKKDFRRVVELLQPLEERLSAAEKKKLDYARKALH